MGNGTLNLCVAALLLFAAGTLSAGDGVSAAPKKKLIEVGWDMPTTGYLRDHWQEMEKNTPFDGVVFRVEGQDEQGNKHPSGDDRFWDKLPLKREWLRQAADDLKACQFKQFTDNFILLRVTPGNIDWFDDAGWAVLAEKMGHLAWLAKEGRCKGIYLDAEMYLVQQFTYNFMYPRGAAWAFQPATKHTFDETRAMARKRGAQLMSAMGKEYPDITLMSVWLFSMEGFKFLKGAPLETDAGGLFPSFVNGFLDTLPPEARLVDATENAYRYNYEINFLHAYHAIRQGGSIVAPENRVKYAAQVSVGFGFFLDMYLNPRSPRNNWYTLSASGIAGATLPNGARLQALRENLAMALQASDEYVWVYGEQCKWWPIVLNNDQENALKNLIGKGRLWEEATPGMREALEYAKDPLTGARKKIAAAKAAKTLKNLAVNSGCEEEKIPQAPNSPQPPDWNPTNTAPGFATYQDGSGTFSWDRTVGCESRSSLKAIKVKSGCFMQTFAVKPGEVYAMEADARKQGQGNMKLAVRWQSQEGNWLVAENFDVSFVFSNIGKEWQHAFGAVTVPEGAGSLVLFLGVDGQKSEEDICWFDNLGIYRMADIP